MNNLSRRLLAVLVGCMLFASSCVKDGDEPCPNYLSIIYDYNMENVDLFHKQASFLSLFMFDAETGVLVREVKQAQQPFPEKYTMPVPEEWFDRKYTLVVWAGLDADSYDFPALTPGSSTISDFQLKVKGYENRLVDRTSGLQPLWHGVLNDVTFTSDEEKHYTVSLMKDTKTFRVVVQYFENDRMVPLNDIDVRLLSANGWYDNNNTVLDAPDRDITYLPYYTDNDPEVGYIAEMNSLRLMNEATRVNTLRLSDTSSGDIIIELPLIEYLNALRLMQYAHMPLQEYVDREDKYHILILLKEGGGGEAKWIASRISINDWVVRNMEYK